MPTIMTYARVKKESRLPRPSRLLELMERVSRGARSSNADLKLDKEIAVLDTQIAQLLEKKAELVKHRVGTCRHLLCDLVHSESYFEDDWSRQGTTHEAIICRRCDKTLWNDTSRSSW
jgi:hypothetical protein